MNKFKGYLILSDIDGTLTNSKGEISAANAEAIRYFQEEGGLLTVASGRYPWYIEKYSDSFVPNTYIIGINGTMVYDPIKKIPVVTKTLEEDFIAKLHICLDSIPEIQYILVSSPKREITIEKDDFGRIDELLAELDIPWCRIILCQRPEDIPTVRAALVSLFGDSYNYDSSWSDGLEIHPVGSGKGDMLRAMLEILNEDGHEIIKTVCVGDYENDISMLEAVDIGYAVANALDCVKEAADIVTVSNNEDALAKIISEL